MTDRSSTGPRLVPPKRPTQYDLLSMHDEDFESLAARLVRLEFPQAVKPAGKNDGGADMVLAGAKEEAGHERCWQAKHFTGPMRWEQCDKSLTAAQEHWRPRHYTFVFPRDLTVTEATTFTKRYGHLDIAVDYWNGDRIQGMLTGSDEGRRVASTFFEDVEADKANQNRAIEVSGRLESAQDALDRLTNIGGYLASGDAYFSYPGATHESGGLGPPPTPGTVMSFSTDDGTITSRIDVVPRDAEAMERYGPEFTLSATDDEAGRRAAERLNEALREGKEVEIGSGLEVTPTRMPPGMQDVVGKTLTGGTVRIGPVERRRRKAKPWRARLTVKGVNEENAVSVLLTQTPSVPDGWQDSFAGEVGGMAVTVLLRELESGGGQIKWNFRHRRDSSPVREQLRALTFMRTLGSGGKLVIDGEQGRLSESPVNAEPLPPAAHALIAFFEDIRTIEEWTKIEFDLPEVVEADEARGIARIARMIHDGGTPVTWEHFDAVVTDPQMAREGHLIRVERELTAKIFGRVTKLGFTRLDLAEYDVVVKGPAPGDAKGTSVRVQASGDHGNETFEQLVRTRTTARRPPPPPPRKVHRQNRRKRGKGKKRGK